MIDPEKYFKLWLTIVAGYAILCVAFTGLLVYAAIHFIGKYW